MLIAVDLDPAIIGFLGVLTGVVAAQFGDWARWKRAQTDVRRARQQASLLDLLRHTSVAVGCAGTIADMLKSLRDGHSKKLTIDTNQVDAACTGASVATDEIRVLGPAALAEPAVDLFVEILEVRQAALRGVAPDELQVAVARVYAAKLRLIEKAAEHDLADSQGGISVESDERALQTRSTVVVPRED